MALAWGSDNQKFEVRLIEDANLYQDTNNIPTKGALVAPTVVDYCRWFDLGAWDGNAKKYSNKNGRMIINTIDVPTCTLGSSKLNSCFTDFPTWILLNPK